MPKGYSYYIEQDRKTLKGELRSLKAMRDQYRKDLETWIRCGNPDKASHYAARLAEYERSISECARAHDVLVWTEETTGRATG